MPFSALVQGDQETWYTLRLPQASTREALEAALVPLIMRRTGDSRSTAKWLAKSADIAWVDATYLGKPCTQTSFDFAHEAVQADPQKTTAQLLDQRAAGDPPGRRYPISDQVHSRNPST